MSTLLLGVLPTGKGVTGSEPCVLKRHLLAERRGMDWTLVNDAATAEQISIYLHKISDKKRKVSSSPRPHLPRLNAGPYFLMLILSTLVSGPVK